MIYVLAYLPAIIILLLFVGVAVYIVYYFKSFYAGRADRAKKAEEHRKQHGGECILEWSGSFANGAADTEFGKLVVEVPKKRGNGAARFYEKGLVLENKRLPYSEIKDVVFSSAGSGNKFNLKQAAREMGALWIYPKKGATIGLREISYKLDNEIMEKIKEGLGF